MFAVALDQPLGFYLQHLINESAAESPSSSGRVQLQQQFRENSVQSVAHVVNLPSMLTKCETRPTIKQLASCLLSVTGGQGKCRSLQQK